jgi:hypothetical protein
MRPAQPAPRYPDGKDLAAHGTKRFDISTRPRVLVVPSKHVSEAALSRRSGIFRYGIDNGCLRLLLGNGCDKPRDPEKPPTRRRPRDRREELLKLVLAYRLHLLVGVALEFGATLREPQTGGRVRAQERPSSSAVASERAAR